MMLAQSFFSSIAAGTLTLSRTRCHQARLFPAVPPLSRDLHSFLVQELRCRKKFTPPVLDRLEEPWLHDFGLDVADSRVEDDAVSFLQVLLDGVRLVVVKSMAESGVSRRDCWYPFEAKLLRGPLVAAISSMDENTGRCSVPYAPPNVGKLLIHVRVFLKRQLHDVAEQFGGVLRVFRGFLEQGVRRHANHVLHGRFAKLQCRREKFRRIRKLVHDINQPAACFGHDGLIDRIQRVQNAMRVVFTENPQVKCICPFGLGALEQPQGRRREFVTKQQGQRTRPRKHCGESARHSDSRRAVFAASVRSLRRFVSAASPKALQI